MFSSRRNFLKSSATLAATVALAGSKARARTLPQVAHQPSIEQFDYSDVQLLPSPLATQFERNHAFYRALDDDRLLKVFRERALLPTPGEDMGGWYDWDDHCTLQTMHGFCPGHTLGQYISGLSRAYAATGDPLTRAKVERLVRGYEAAISDRFWVGNRFPAYITDKLTIGLIDAQTFAGVDTQSALDRTWTTVEPHLPPGPLGQHQQLAKPHTDDSFCWDEPYTLAENLLLAWRRGYGDRYRDLARHFLPDDWYFNPLSEGHNALPGMHAYSHVNALSSAAQAYLALGDEKHLRAAQNGFRFVLEQSFATGGWGPDEHFRPMGKGELGESLSKTHASFETPCGCYAQFKITRYLMRITGQSTYGDAMERVLYNAILGARPLQPDGHGFYYSDYNNDGSKFYHQNQWACCTGTFPQITADYGISTYFHDATTLYVNLYHPSRVTWRRATERITVEQQTEYPYQPTTRLTVRTATPANFALALRIPAWAGPATRVLVNGKPVLTSPEPGRFASLKRQWKDGDHVEIEFAFTTRLEAVDAEHPNLEAVVSGPLALFAVGAIPASVRRSDLLAAQQTKPGSSDWQAGPLTLRAFPAIDNEHYRLYLPTAD